MRKVKTILVLVSLGIIFSFEVMAQPRPPSNQVTSGNQSPGNPPIGSPIDQGTGILLILAAVYGFKKFKSLSDKACKC